MLAANFQVALLFTFIVGSSAIAHPDYSDGATRHLVELKDVERAGVALLSMSGQPQAGPAYDVDGAPFNRQTMINIAISLSLSLAAAYYFKTYYKMPDHDPQMKVPDFQTWSSGPFDCLENMGICAWSLFCPAARWAGNMSMVSLLDFWPAVAIFLCLQVLGFIPGLTLCAVVLLLVMVYYRNKMRNAFNMPTANEPSTLCVDCVFVCCCSCCAIAQEARHLEVACKVNHEAVAAQRPVLEQAPAQETA